MRVLCSTTPMEGIFGPFIPLGRALAEAGHDVIVATGSNLQSAVEENGFEYVQAGLSAWDGVRGAADDPDVKAAPAADRIAFPAAMFGHVHPSAKLPVLREFAAAQAIDLIIHPPVDLSSPLLAAELELPTACYGFGQPLDPQVLAAMAERIRPAWESANLEPDLHGGVYRGRYLDPRPPSLHAAHDVAAEAGTLAIRPEIPGEPAATLPPWAATLGHRPAVYVSLGTAPLFNQPEKFTPLLEGLAELDLDVVVTVSNLNDPEALAKPHTNVYIERWLPLAPLLPRCAAVLCHAGSGTTLAALAAGLPLVLVPQGADQFDNARACERAGAARVLAPDQVSAPAIRDAISAVLDTSSTERTQARQLAEQIASMPSAVHIAETLDAAVRDAHDPNAAYALGSSSRESARLQRQSEELAPDSLALLDHVSLRPGDSAIDIGCGPRGIIDLLAERVVPDGRVVGLDSDSAHLAMAQELVRMRGWNHVEVILGDARDTGLPADSFDLVHARTVLVTIPDPVSVLTEMVRLARPGGWVAGIEADMEIGICHPPDPAFERLSELFQAAFSRNGANPQLGRGVAELYRQAGLEDVTVEARAPVYPPGHSRRSIRADLVRSMRPQIVALGLADELELDELDRAAREHFANPNTLVMSGLLFLTWGRKPV